MQSTVDSTTIETSLMICGIFHITNILIIIIVLFADEETTIATQILRTHSEKLHQHVLSVDAIHMLYTERVISKDTLCEVKRLGGRIDGVPLIALREAVSKNPKHLRVFTSILLRSTQSVPIAKDILKHYGKYFLLNKIYYRFVKYIEDTQKMYSKETELHCKRQINIYSNYDIVCFSGISTSTTNLDFRRNKRGNITGTCVTKSTKCTYIIIFYSYFEGTTSQTESIVSQEGMHACMKLLILLIC